MKESDAMDPLLRRTARAGGDTRPPGACLDAETLAAWADGGLPAAQRALVEAHVADCDRCLAMAGAMATTAPPTAEAEGPTWSPIRWLLPLTTAAVAVTAWLVVRPAEPPTISTAPVSDAAEMAKPTETLSGAETELRERAESRRADQPAPQRKAAPPPADPTAPPTAAAVPPAQPVGELKDERQQAFARSAQLSGVILSPDPNIRWRLRGSVVERTTDGAASWVAQEDGVDTELLAGASPARDVAWIVGRRGTILLTTDGTTWERLPFPEKASDLVAITAQDAARATVTTSDGRTYVTTDGGRNWSLQENPAGPF
jgi:hypothetical protein